MSRKKGSQVSNIQNIKSMSIYLSSTGLQTIRKKLYMSQHPTKCGVEILPTSVSMVDLCISLPLLTGIAKLCLHIKFQTLWMQHLLQMSYKRHLKSILNPKYLTLIRGANTRVMNIPNYSKIMRFKSQ